MLYFLLYKSGFLCYNFYVNLFLILFFSVYHILFFSLKERIFYDPQIYNYQIHDLYL